MSKIQESNETQESDQDSEATQQKIANIDNSIELFFTLYGIKEENQNIDPKFSKVLKEMYRIQEILDKDRNLCALRRNCETQQKSIQDFQKQIYDKEMSNVEKHRENRQIQEPICAYLEHIQKTYKLNKK